MTDDHRQTARRPAFRDREALQAHYGPARDVALSLRKDRLDHIHRAYIDNAPLFCIATADENGKPAVSPRGGEPGFVRILDDRTLLIPDWHGDRQLFSLRNIQINPQLSIVFFVPGVVETLRIEGRGRVSLDATLMEECRVGGRKPLSVLVVDIDITFIHCGKALVRARLWDEDRRPPKGAVPGLAVAVKEQVAPPGADEPAIESLVSGEYATTLYINERKP